MALKCMEDLFKNMTFHKMNMKIAKEISVGYMKNIALNIVLMKITHL